MSSQQSQPCAQNVIDVFNSVLDDNNRKGWRVLQTVSMHHTLLVLTILGNARIIMLSIEWYDDGK